MRILPGHPQYQGPHQGHCASLHQTGQHCQSEHHACKEQNKHQHEEKAAKKPDSCLKTEGFRPRQALKRIMVTPEQILMRLTPEQNDNQRCGPGGSVPLRVNTLGNINVRDISANKELKIDLCFYVLTLLAHMYLQCFNLNNHKPLV